MSLPPALLARLKRRKIIQDISKDEADKSIEDQTTETGNQRTTHVDDEVVQKLPDEEPKEEILAEDYSEEDDDDEDGPDTGSENSQGGDDDGYGENFRDTKDHIDITNAILHESGQRDNETFRKEVNLASLIAKGESVIGCPNKYNVYHTCTQYCMDNHGEPETTEPTLEQRKQLASILKTYPLPDDWVVVFEPGVNTFYFWNILTNLVTWFPPSMNVFPSLSANQIRKFMQNMDGTQTVMTE